MLNPFDALIKNIKRELIDIKNAPRRSTLTLQTISKSITVSFSATADQWGGAYATTIPVVNINFEDDIPQIWMASFDSKTPASPFPMQFVTNLATNGNNGAVVINPGRLEGLNPGQTYTASVKINIIATGDFTLTAGSIAR